MKRYNIFTLLFFISILMGVREKRARELLGQKVVIRKVSKDLKNN